MPLVSPSEGEKQLLTDLFTGGTLENHLLKLYTNSHSPTATSSTASFTEATFSGYTAKTLTRSVSGSTWSTPTSATPSVTQYNSASPQSWSATSAQTISGYYIVGATSGKVVWAEAFASAISLVNPSTFTLIPQLTLT